LLTGVCAINCRYCFRRHFPYKENNPGRNGLEEVFDYIRQDPSIQEVILSGGDPLLATDPTLTYVIEALEAIPHVRIIRFHTRIPIVLPERITDAFLSILKQTRLTKVMVLHCNHAQEIDAEVEQVCHKLKAAGCHLLNQSVLLKGINDEVDVLESLSKKLFDCGVLPYYLHLLDKVTGTQHFDLPEADARALFQALQKRLPGYLLPKLVREEPGKRSKTLLV
jgi:EF-P beta-lysylation protein EpmB